MDRYAEMFATNIGLSKISEVVFYGIYRGYELNFFYVGKMARFPYRILISSRLTQNAAQGVCDILVNTKHPESYYQAGEVGLTVLVEPTIAEKAVTILPIALDKAIDALMENNCPNADYSPYSGMRMDEGNSRIVKAGSLQIRLTNDDVEAYNKLIKANEERQEQNKVRSSSVGAFFGALLGAAIGAGVEIGVLYLIGFCGASAFMALVLSTLFYRLFRGAPGVNMLVQCSLLTFIATFAGAIFVYFQSAIASFPELSGGDAIAEAFKNGQYLGAFIAEMVALLVFLAGGIVLTALRLKRAKRKPLYLE